MFLSKHYYVRNKLVTCNDKSTTLSRTPTLFSFFTQVTTQQLHFNTFTRDLLDTSKYFVCSPYCNVPQPLTCVTSPVYERSSGWQAGLTLRLKLMEVRSFNSAAISGISRAIHWKGQNLSTSKYGKSWFEVYELCVRQQTKSDLCGRSTFEDKVMSFYGVLC